MMELSRLVGGTGTLKNTFPMATRMLAHTQSGQEMATDGLKMAQDNLILDL